MGSFEQPQSFSHIKIEGMFPSIQRSLLFLQIKADMKPPTSFPMPQFLLNLQCPSRNESYQLDGTSHPSGSRSAENGVLLCDPCPVKRDPENLPCLPQAGVPSCVQMVVYRSHGC